MEIHHYGDWSSQINQRVVNQRIPIIGTIELTSRCNLRCIHCYNTKTSGDQHSQRGEELTYNEHCRILDEATESGCLWACYTGGEIFTRPDFLEIYTYAKRRGVLITLFTNGTLITPRIADLLAEWRPFSIEITLYGRTKETYEQITGIIGSYEKCMQGIQLLMDRGLPLKLKTVVLTANKHEIGDMKQFAEKDLELEFRFDTMINPGRDCSKEPLAFRLSPQQVVEMDLMDSKRLSEWNGFCEQFNGPISSEQNNGLYHCGGGIKSFSIDPYGQMGICLLLAKERYDLRAGSFKEGWENVLIKVRREQNERHTKCTACQIKAMCGMCPANGWLENCDKEEPVDFLCRVAHLRAHAFGFTVPPHGECEFCESGIRYEELMCSFEQLSHCA